MWVVAGHQEGGWYLMTGAMQRLSRCEVCLLRGVVVQDGLVVTVAGAGVVASMEVCPTRHVDDSIDLLVREWERFLYPGCISSGSSS